MQRIYCWIKSLFTEYEWRFLGFTALICLMALLWLIFIEGPSLANR